MKTTLLCLGVLLCIIGETGVGQQPSMDVPIRKYYKNNRNWNCWQEVAYVYFRRPDCTHDSSRYERFEYTGRGSGYTVNHIIVGRAMEAWNQNYFRSSAAIAGFDLSSVYPGIEFDSVAIELRMILGWDGNNNGPDFVFNVKQYGGSFYNSLIWPDSIWNKADYDSAHTGINYGTLTIPRSAALDDTAIYRIVFDETDPFVDKVESAVGTAVNIAISEATDDYYFPSCVGEHFGWISQIHMYVYPKANTKYYNDYGYSDPNTSKDFEVADSLSNITELEHAGEMWWMYNTKHDVTMFSPDSIIHSKAMDPMHADDRPYNRLPRVWKKAEVGMQESYDPTPDNQWQDVQIENDANFTARYYRMVDNQFYAYKINPGYAVSIGSNIAINDSFRIDGISVNNGYIVQQRRNIEDDQITASVPLIQMDNAVPSYFVCWDQGAEPNMHLNTRPTDVSIDRSNNSVTTVFVPDIHHLDIFSNPYRACYAGFKAWAFEQTNQNTWDITDQVAIKVGDVNTADNSWNITVPKKVTVNGTEYYFAAWWDNVYGSDNGDGTVTRKLLINHFNADHYRYNTVAMYKAYRKMGDQRSATKTNSQRKIVADNAGVLHMAYESSGTIWYSKSSDKGVTWSPELKCSERFSMNAHSPSIAINNTSNGIPVIVYADDHLMYGGIYVVQPYWPDSTYADPHRVYYVKDTLTNCIPTIAINNEKQSKMWMTVWNKANNLRFALKEGYDSSIAPIVDNQVFVAGAKANPAYPSIGWMSENQLPSDDSYEFHTSWIENGDVCFAPLRIVETSGVPAIAANYWQSGTGTLKKETIHTSGQTGIVGKALFAPSLTVDNAEDCGGRARALIHTYVAYEIENLSPTGSTSTTSKWPVVSLAVSPARLMSRTPATIASSALPSSAASSRLMVKERIAAMTSQGVISQWNNTPVLYATNHKSNIPLNPSAGVLNGCVYPGLTNGLYKSEYVRTLFQYDSSRIRVARRTRSIQKIDDHAEGRDPNIVILSDPGTIMAAYCDSISSPLRWGVRNTNYNLAKTATSEEIEMREIFVGDSNKVAVFGVCNPRWLNVSNTAGAIAWNPQTDSIGSDYYYPIPLRMRTETFNTAGKDSLLYELELASENRDQFETSNAFILRIHQAENGNVLMQRSYPMRDLPETGYIYMLTGLNIASLGNRNVYLTFDVSDDIDTAQVEVAHFCSIIDDIEDYSKLVNWDQAPSSVTLAQNYPNPFNPTTEITFGIPESGNVKLSVYDNLGREVKVLVHEYKDAGTYTVQFNADRLPSGMYLYKIETPNGTLSRKMMLMK